MKGMQNKMALSYFQVLSQDMHVTEENNEKCFRILVMKGLFAWI
jgi:hypothetical protein